MPGSVATLIDVAPTQPGWVLQPLYLSYDGAFSGSVSVPVVSVQQLLPLGPGIFGFGVNGFLYEQISGDSDSGATSGDFKGRSMGIGPVLDYIVPTETGALVFEAKWLPELDTRNRLDGDYFWFKVAWQF